MEESWIKIIVKLALRKAWEEELPDSVTPHGSPLLHIFQSALILLIIFGGSESENVRGGVRDDFPLHLWILKLNFKAFIQNLLDSITALHPSSSVLRVRASSPCTSLIKSSLWLVFFKLMYLMTMTAGQKGSGMIMIIVVIIIVIVMHTNGEPKFCSFSPHFFVLSPSFNPLSPSFHTPTLSVGAASLSPSLMYSHIKPIFYNTREQFSATSLSITSLSDVRECTEVMSEGMDEARKIE